MNVLHIDSSILGEHSVSRQLSAAVVARLSADDDAVRVTYRDLASDPTPQFSGALAGASQVPQEMQSPQLQSETATLATLLEEVLSADVIVIGAPMYNFSVPSQLKAWIDALAVPGKTFQYEAQGPRGLLGAKRVIVASARGGFYGAATPSAPLDHQETFLKGFFGFLGVTRVDIVRAEGLKVSPELRARGLAAGLAQVAELELA